VTADSRLVRWARHKNGVARRAVAPVPGRLGTGQSRGPEPLRRGGCGRCMSWRRPWATD